MMKPHRAEAERFLKALDPRVKHHTFQTFDDNAQRKDPQLTRMIHGTLSHQFDTLSRLNAAGAGIFVTVNMTDLRGRKADNIVQARCLFVDLDGAPLPKSGPKPHIVTETSAEHFHVYWRVKDLALENFADHQRALIEQHGGDPCIVDLPRVMRVPGFAHCKGEPRLVRLVSARFGAVFSASSFPIVKSEPRQSNAVATAEDGRLCRALAFIPNDDWDWKPWCDLGLAIYRATGGRQIGFTMFDAWSKRSVKYNEAFTRKTWRGFERSPPSKIGAGTIFWLAYQYVPKWADWLDEQQPDALDAVQAFLETMDDQHRAASL